MMNAFVIRDLADETVTVLWWVITALPWFIGYMAIILGCAFIWSRLKRSQG